MACRIPGIDLRSGGYQHGGKLHPAGPSGQQQGSCAVRGCGIDLCSLLQQLRHHLLMAEPGGAEQFIFAFRAPGRTAYEARDNKRRINHQRQKNNSYP